MKLATKIWMSLAILLIGYAVSVVTSYLLGNRVTAVASHIRDSIYPVASRTDGIAAKLNTVWLLQKDSVVQGDPADIVRAENLASQIVVEMRAVGVIEGIPPAFGQNLLDTATAIEALSRDAGPIYRGLILAADNPSAELQERAQVIAGRRNELTGIVAALSADAARRLRAELQSIEDLSQMQSRASIIVFLLVMIVSIPLVSLSIRLIILKPFQRLLKLSLIHISEPTRPY